MTTLKARLLTGTYPTSKPSQVQSVQIDQTCTISGEEPQARRHFNLRCKSLADSRDVHMKINLYLHNHKVYQNDIADAILSNEHILLHS